MKITAIKQQIKRQDRYSVYGDDKYLFSFSESELLNTGLRIGQTIDATNLNLLKEKAAIDKAYDRAINLVSRRPRSEWELNDYFKKKGTEEGVAAAATEKLRQRGYINDADFAKRWVENRRLLKPISKLRLQQELRQKRINDDIIKQVLSNDETDELQVVKELIEKKSRQTKYQDKTKLMQFLARQGFSYDLIKQALSSDYN